jgi:hypothetical protein
VERVLGAQPAKLGVRVAEIELGPVGGERGHGRPPRIRASREILHPSTNDD